MFTAYDLVLCRVSCGTDLEVACRIEQVNFERMVAELDRNDRIRRQWMMAERLWQMVAEIRSEAAKSRYGLPRT